MKEKIGQLDGLLVLNKPKGPTSAGCIDRIKKKLGQKKIGHAGTLDPMATGVLLVLLGQGTKIAQYLTEGGKTYYGTLILGVSTDTYDMEGKVTAENSFDNITPDQVKAEVKAWTELTSQVVPPYSAAKHKGKPLYKIAREGETPPVKEKEVSITRAELLELEIPRASFRVDCGAGAYIRSLVHSLGMRLGCGAVLSQLTREYSHPFGLDQAYDLDQVLDEPEKLRDKVLPLAECLPHWPKFTLSSKQVKLFKNGVQLPVGPGLVSAGGVSQGGKAMFLDQEGQPLGLAQTRLTDGQPVWAVLRGLWR